MTVFPINNGKTRGTKRLSYTSKDLVSVDVFPSTDVLEPSQDQLKKNVANGSSLEIPKRLNFMFVGIVLPPVYHYFPYQTVFVAG